MSIIYTQEYYKIKNKYDLKCKYNNIAKRIILNLVLQITEQMYSYFLIDYTQSQYRQSY